MEFLRILSKIQSAKFHTRRKLACLQKDDSSEENYPSYFLENNIVRCGHGKHKNHNLEIWAFKLLLYFCSFHDLVTSVGKFKDPSSGMQEVAKEAHLAMRSNS